MKLLMENFRLYEQELLWEAEFNDFFNKHFCIIDEGIIDSVLSAGSSIKDAVVNTFTDMKDWAADKIQSFVKFMGEKMIQLISWLREKGVYKRYQHRREVTAVKMLMTNKHIGLAVMIFSAIAKLTGGFVTGGVATVAPEVIQKISALLNSPVAGLKDLLGDLGDVKDMITKFQDYRKDSKSLAGSFGNYDAFGGLAELLSK